MAHLKAVSDVCARSNHAVQDLLWSQNRTGAATSGSRFWVKLVTKAESDHAVQVLLWSQDGGRAATVRPFAFQASPG